MSAIKDGSYPITLNGKDYYLLFSLNALDALQDKYGGYDRLGEIFNETNKDIFKDLKWLLTLLINEGLPDGEQPLTEQQVGKMVHFGNLQQLKTAIFKSFAVGVSGDEEQPDNEGENNEESENDEGNAPDAQAN